MRRDVSDSLLGLVLLAGLAAACGGSSSSSTAASGGPVAAAPTPAPAPAPAPTPAPAPAPAPSPAPSPAAPAPPAPMLAGQATLTWNAVQSPAVAGYRVYYGLAPGSYLQPKGSGINVGKVDTHIVIGLTPGQRYYFAVTAVDANGNESAYSAEASKLVQ